MADFSRYTRDYPPGLTFRQQPMADGWPVRRFDWPHESVRPRGSILFLVGRGDMPEKYLETLAHWHAAGWAISGFDWRGQGGSGRLASDQLVGHALDFAPWISDLAAIAADWKANNPGPHVVIAHSMGGHLALRGVMENVFAPDAMVLNAPMLGFETKPLPTALVVAVVRFLARRNPERMAWPANEKPTVVPVKRQALLTHDERRYSDEMWWQQERPDLVVGPPSLAWLVAAHTSTCWTEAPGRPESVHTPILMLGTEADRLVSPRAIHRFAKRLPNCALHMFGNGAAHELLRETDKVRGEVLARIDQFLDRSAPAK
jgi:lysophospholipase